MEISHSAMQECSKTHVLSPAEKGDTKCDRQMDIQTQMDTHKQTYPDGWKVIPMNQSVYKQENSNQLFKHLQVP